MNQRNNLKYPNLTILFSILFLTYLFLHTGVLHEWVRHIGNFGYISAFLIGIFFVSTFTVVPATAILFFLAEQLGIVPVSILAGFGGMVGDYTIFKFIKDDLLHELRSLFNRVAGENFLKIHWIAQTKYFVWLNPVIGALLIASPLPDELGIGILSVYKLDTRQFLLLTLILDTIGIFVLLSSISAIA